MRFTISYYLFILYAVVIIKPVIPVIGDDLSHEFNRMEHIATVHAIYGDNHVEKEIASNSDNDTKKQTSVKYEEQIQAHLGTEECAIIFYTKCRSKQHCCFRILRLTNIFLPGFSPPPEFV